MSRLHNFPTYRIRHWIRMWIARRRYPWRFAPQLPPDPVDPHTFADPWADADRAHARDAPTRMLMSTGGSDPIEKGSRAAGGEFSTPASSPEHSSSAEGIVDGYRIVDSSERVLEDEFPDLHAAKARGAQLVKKLGRTDLSIQHEVEPGRWGSAFSFGGPAQS